MGQATRIMTQIGIIGASDLLSLTGAVGTIVLASVAILSGRKYVREERENRKERMLKSQRVEDALLGTKGTDVLDPTPSLFVRVSALSDNLDTVKDGQEAIAAAVKQLLPNGGKSVSDRISQMTGQINNITNQITTITEQIGTVVTTLSDYNARLEDHIMKDKPRPQRRQYQNPKSKGTQ